MTRDRVWLMYAHERDGGLWNVGPRPFVELHGLPYPVVPVHVIETLPEIPLPLTTHWGWIKKDGDEPCMIHPHLTLLEICFPYGLKAAEERGLGHAVRLMVIRAGEPPEDAGNISGIVAGLARSLEDPAERERIRRLADEIDQMPDPPRISDIRLPEDPE